jgi:hypothetical protein
MVTARTSGMAARSIVAAEAARSARLTVLSLLE